MNHVAGEWHRTPVCDFFEREIQSLFRSERCVDASRLLTMPSHPAQGKRRLFALMQNVTAVADRHDCRFILAPVRRDHTRFYLGMRFVGIAKPRAFPNWPEPVALLALDWKQQRGTLLRHHLYRHLFSERNAITLPPARLTASARTQWISL